MTSRDFVYWLQGFFELHGHGPLTAEQAACVARHVALVFKHEIDPSMGNEAHQQQLDKIHAPNAPKPSTTPHEAHTMIGGVGPHGTLYRC